MQGMPPGFVQESWGQIPEVLNMSLKKRIQLRNGSVSLSVFLSETDGKALFSLDKDFVGKRVKGPLFQETELYNLHTLIKDYDEWESGVIHGNPLRRLSPTPTHDPTLAAAEIGQAIQHASVIPTEQPVQKRTVTPKTTITVLPSLPQFRYLYTCPKCGLHGTSRLRLSDGVSMNRCIACNHIYGQQC